MKFANVVKEGQEIPNGLSFKFDDFKTVGMFWQEGKMFFAAAILRFGGWMFRIEFRRKR